MPPHLTIESSVDSGHRVVKLQGDLDVATVGIAEAALAQGFEILDFSELEFLDSSGVRVLLQARQALSTPPMIRGLHGQVRRILEMTGVAEMFVSENPEGSASVLPSSLN